MTKKPLSEAEKILARRILARRRLLHFVSLTHGSYEAGWVHADICSRLEKFSADVAAKKSPRLMLLMPPRHGKQMADSTPVPTLSGWIPHGALRPGDRVFGPDGRPTTVLAVSEKTTSDMVVELTDGSVFRCHENHEWRVFERSRGRWTVLSTEAMAKRKLFSGGRAQFQLPVAAPLWFPHADLPMDPYTLGVWLGDGSTTKPCVTHSPADQGVVEEIARRGYEVSAVCTHGETGCATTYFGGPRPNVPGRMSRELKALGLLGGPKRIPRAYLLGSIEQRLELLAGLVDTDGHVEEHTGRVRVVTVSQALATDVYELVNSLGFRAYGTSQGPALSTSGIQGRQTVYTVGFQPTIRIPCILERKAIQRLAPQRRVGVKSIERRPNGEVGHCIQVDRPDGLYLVGERLTVTHNSELASVRFPPWHLGQHPQHEIINVGYNMELPMIFSRKVRELARDPVYQSIFSGMELNPDSQSIEKWNTTKGGGFTAAGVGGGITGKGAHILIIDDPIKNQEEADSIEVRNKLLDWYQSTAYTRLAPGGGILLIQTWWNDDDLAGRLQNMARVDPSADQFEVIKYPALSEAWEYRDRVTQAIVRTAQELDLDESPDLELLRPIDTCLHEARYPTDALKRIRANMQPRIWSALYQQNPMPDEGVYFRKQDFRFYITPPRTFGMNIITAWDFAIGEKQQNDWTVGFTFLQDESNALYVLDVMRFRGDSLEIVDAMLDVANRFLGLPEVNYQIAVEDGQIFRALKPMLELRMTERRMWPAYEVLKPLTDKLARARTLQGRMQQGRVFWPDPKYHGWVNQAITELLRFPGGANDDVVDAAAWAAIQVNKTEPPAQEQPAPMRSWRDQIDRPTMDGSHMTA